MHFIIITANKISLLPMQRQVNNNLRVRQLFISLELLKQYSSTI